MKKTNSVIFKGRGTGMNIVLDNSVDFDVLKETLQVKVREASRFFGNAATVIEFSGRDLSEHEETELLEIISKTSDLSISFVNSYAQVQKIVSKAPAVPPFISADENQTIFHRGSLRSGQPIRFAGSVVVIGDINPGAEIIAEGNIIVMGSVKGLVHAGCSGNANCFVSAMSLTPIQLRISDIITYIPKEMEKNSKNVPSYAYVEKGQIFIVPLMLK